MGSLPFQQKDGEVAMIVFSFLDTSKDQIIDLAAYGFTSKAEFEKHWAMLPPVTGKASFVADEYDENGNLGDTKDVTAETIEAITSRPIAALIEEGRQALSKVLADWKAERASRTAA